jgi:hypothetical protein
MGIYNNNSRGHYPYSFQVEPYYNGAPITSQNQVVINPRFQNVTTADNFAYSVDGDYAPTAATGGNAYADLTLSFAQMTAWYAALSGHGGPNNELGHPGSTGNWVNAARPFYQRQDGSSLSGKFSMWMMLHVGQSPHPGTGVAETYFSMVTNANGDYGGGAFYAYPGNVPTPSSPREWFNGSRKIRVSGDNYGNGAYRGWTCIANQQTISSYISNINPTTLRIINLGRQTTDNTAQLRIAGFRIIYHILPGPGGDYGNFDV